MTSEAGRMVDDYHVHSTWSDDAISPLEDNVAVALQRGLRTLCMVEHVRRSSTWVPQFVEAAAALPRQEELNVLIGVEAKILDVSGTLDLPEDCEGFDHLLVADHQFPLDDRCHTPDDVRSLLAAGTVSVGDLVTSLIDATSAAIDGRDHVILAHLFSILPKVGLRESVVPPAGLDHLARCVARAGAWVEVNEKWSCPSSETLRHFVAAGVPLVLSTDAHDCRSVGLYEWARAARSEAEDADRPATP